MIEPRPVVECSFVAEFYDHIYVAMDAEVILFLHDLVSSYIREKDKGKCLCCKACSSVSPERRCFLDCTYHFVKTENSEANKK